MTNLGPGLVYGLFVLAGPVVLGLPIAAGSYVLARRVDGFHRALGLVVGGIGLIGAIAALASGVDPGTARIPAALGVAYVVWPLLVAMGVLTLGLEEAPDPAARRATAGWLIADVLLAGSLFVAGTPLWDALSRTPSAFGMAWFTGFVALTGVVGLVAAVVGAALPGAWLGLRS